MDKKFQELSFPFSAAFQLGQGVSDVRGDVQGPVQQAGILLTDPEGSSYSAGSKPYRTSEVTDVLSYLYAGLLIEFG